MNSFWLKINKGTCGYSIELKMAPEWRNLSEAKMQALCNMIAELTCILEQGESTDAINAEINKLLNVI